LVLLELAVHLHALSLWEQQPVQLVQQQEQQLVQALLEKQGQEQQLAQCMLKQQEQQE